jgi:hypothetical protein
MREQDFKSLTGWVDYDRPHLPGLTKSQEIRYFQRRLKRTVLAPLWRMCIDDTRGWTNESPVLCFGTCVCCAIEALGKFYTGKIGRGVSGHNFVAFVQKYMDPGWLANSFKGQRYVDHLWASFRNGLAHGFVIKEGGFERQRTLFEVKPVRGAQQLEIDPTRLFRDFKCGAGRFARDLRAASTSDPLFVNFHTAFDGVFIRGL